MKGQSRDFTLSLHILQILHLQGIRYLFDLNIFLYCLFAFVGLSAAWLSLKKGRKWERKTEEKKMEEAYS